MLWYCLNNILFKRLGEHFYIQEVHTNYYGIEKQLQDKFLGQNLLKLSFSDIQTQIEEILNGRYSNLRIKKILPSSLEIEITINPPIAYKAISDNKKLFFDSYGKVTYQIPDDNQVLYDNLIQLSGTNVEFNFIEIISFIKSIDNIECVKLEFVDSRRWNLHLKNGCVVKLSQENYRNTLLFLQKIINKSNLMDEVAIIDLRFYPKKIFVTNK